MPSTVSTAFVSMYSSNIQILAQQAGSKLFGAVDMESVRGEDAYFDQIGAVDAVLKTTRQSDTPIGNTPFSRRKVTMATHHFGDLIDNDDIVRMLTDPTSQLVKNVAHAMGRVYDKQILAAAVGNAATGHDGGTAVALPAAQIIESTAATIFTVDKLIEAKTIMDAADIPEEDRFIAVQAADMKNLLGATQIGSADYNTVKALVHGNVDTFMGFKFIRVSDRVWTAAGVADNVAIAFQKDCMKLGIGQDIFSRVSERADKNYAVQVYSEVTSQAVRMAEGGVVKINNLAAPAP